MKQCARCGQQLNDNEQFCTRCGGTNFRVIGTQGSQGQQVRNNMTQQRPNGAPNNNGMQQRPVQNNQRNQYQQQGNFQGQQRQQVNRPNNQQVRPQINRPGQANNNMQQPGAYNMQQNEMNNQPVNSMENMPMKLRKMSRKEKQSKEMELMYAKKAANERGEYFDDEEFKRQHGWYEDRSATVAATTDMTVGDWIKTLLLMLIPLVNIVVAVLGIKNVSTPEYKKNYYKAFMIYYIIAFILSALVTFLL